MAGIDVVHIPYKASSLAAIDLIGGQLQFELEAIGAEVVDNSSEEYQAATRAEIPRWEKVVREIAAKGI